MPLEPMNDNLVIERMEAEDVTKGGIVLPDSAKKKPMKGKVLATGPGRWNQAGDKRIPLSVKTGDVVLFERYASNAEVEVDGKTVLVMSEGSIMGSLVE